MGIYRFSTRQRFRWEDKEFEIRRILPNDMINIENLQTGETITVEQKRLVKDLFDAKLEFLIDGQPLSQAFLSGYIDISECPSNLRAVAEWRLGMIQPFLDMPSRERKKAMQRHVAAQKAKEPESPASMQTAVSVTSLYRWLRDYERSGRDLRALVPATTKRGGKNVPRLSAEVESELMLVLEDKFFVRERRTIDDFHRELAVRINEKNLQRSADNQLVLPSRDTVARRIETLDAERRLIAKRGARSARQILTQYGKTDYPTEPLERVEIDHTKIDLITVGEHSPVRLGRLTLTFATDVATRYPLGYCLSYEPPGYTTVMQCLQHCIWYKSDVRERYNTEHDWLAYGIPNTLVIDNGKEFVGHDLDDACTLLGIRLQRTPVQTPRFKAAVERMFGTLNTGLFHSLPGTTFSNPKQKTDYDSLKHACITLSVLDAMMHIFLLDMYSMNIHQGLGAKPAERWEQATANGFKPRMPQSVEELRMQLGRVTKRTIHAYGIELFSIPYNCDELIPLRTHMSKQENREVKVKYDPADLSCIHVYDSNNAKYIKVPSLVPSYTTGLSLWTHRVVSRFVRREQGTVDLVALGRARRKIDNMVDESLSQRERRTHSKEARYLHAGQGSKSPGEEGQSAIPLDNSASSDELTNLGETLVDVDLDVLKEAGWDISYNPLLDSRSRKRR